MSDFADRVRDAASAHIADIAGKLTQLKQSGNDLVGCCPFHSEDGPSFRVHPESGSWKCFGCDRGGSVFDLVMERDQCTFWDAVKHLAEEYRIPLPSVSDEDREKAANRQSAYDYMERFVAASQKNLQKHPEVIEYLHEQGITDDSIKKYRVGLGVKIKTTGKDAALAEAAGLIRNNWQPMDDRIVFPVISSGKVVQMAGRKLPHLDKNKEIKKYLSLPNTPIREGLTPWQAWRLRGQRCIIVEGVKDALLLEQAGFPACATVSATFKEEWLRYVGHNTLLYVCYDGDEPRPNPRDPNGPPLSPGQEANKAVASMLADAGHKVSIVELPEPYDPADFISEKDGEAFQELVSKATTLTEYLIGQLPESITEHEQDKLLRPIYDRLSSASAAMRDRYIAALSKHTGIARAALRTDIEQRQPAKRATFSLDDPPPDGLWTIKWRETDPIFFNASQDVISDVLYYTVYLQVESGAFMPFVITSDREIFPLEKGALMERDFVIRGQSTPSNGGRWSIGSDVPFNVRDYLDGKATVKPAALFARIRWYFKRFLRFPDPFYYDYLALWVMATYHFRLYDAFGYTFLSAIKSSGKTQTLNLINLLAFNSKQADAITEAALKRSVAADAATLLYDEAEKLWRKFEKDESSFQEVIKGGYSKSGTAMSVNKETHVVEHFTTYSPKVFANTRGLDDTMADRCITLYLQRDVGKIPQFVEAEQIGRIRTLRNQLYCFSLQFIGDLAEMKQAVERPDGLSGRDWQLWQAVIVLAKLLDGFHAAQPVEALLDSGEAVTLNGLYDRMVTMAIERREYKAAIEEENNPEYRCLMALWAYVCEHPTTSDWYVGTDLCKAITDETGWEKFSSEQLSRLLFDRLHIARNRASDKKKRRIPGTVAPRWHYRLDRDLMRLQARRVFGKELVETEITKEELFSGETA